MTRPAPRAYRSQVSVERVTAHLFIVRATPHPIHAAQVAASTSRGRVTGWSVTMLTTVDPMRRGGMAMDAALCLAAEWVGTMTGQMIKERFHGVQRTAMGQGRCPYLGKVLCLGPPVPGSVWCDQHPQGRKAVGE